MIHKKENTYLIRIGCAAFTINGCDSLLEWETDKEDFDESPLTLRGWRRWGNLWVCEKHPIES